MVNQKRNGTILALSARSYKTLDCGYRIQKMKRKTFFPIDCEGKTICSTHSLLHCVLCVGKRYIYHIYIARMYIVSVWLWLHRHMYSIYYTYIFDSMIYWLAPLSYWASFCHNGQCCLFLSERRSFVFRFLFVTYWRKQWLIIIRVYYSVYWSVNILYRRFVFSHSVCALR